VFATAVLVIAVSAALFGPRLANQDPLKQNLRERFVPPFWVDGGSQDHPLGTDHLGRDVLARMLYGSRVSLFVAAVALGFGLFVGTASGLVAGYFGGIVDEIIMRLVDLWLALPFLLLALVVAVTIGGGLVTTIWLLAINSWSAGARNIRGEVLSLRTRDYVALAHVAGASHSRILYRHLLPQVAHILLVITSMRAGGLIIAEAGLSFLGIGVQGSETFLGIRLEGSTSLGVMVSEGQSYLLTAWWLSIIPGMVIFFIVAAFNFLGDWMRDRFDPRLRQI
jgi:peptide/nickel transport system permease protein